MDRAAFCRQSSVVVVAGKGGVGKTTVTAALARFAADVGLEVLVVALDESAALPKLFGLDAQCAYDEATWYESPERAAASAEAAATAEAESDQPGARRRARRAAHEAAAAEAAGESPPRPPGGRVTGRVITPDDALLEYLEDHGLRRVAKRLVASGVLDVVATAIPGLREILVLGKVKQLERSGRCDLIVVDAPAAGHAVTFLTSAAGLVDAARSGPLRTQAQDVVEMLQDPTRCQVMLVTLPEETPVNELIETAFRFEDQVGVALAPVVVNGAYPVLHHLDADPTEAAKAAGVPVPGPDELLRLERAASFRAARQRLQSEQTARLAIELPLAQLHLPYCFTAELGPDELALLARALGESVDALVAEEAA